jgi:hypothetical protein
VLSGPFELCQVGRLSPFARIFEASATCSQQLIRNICLYGTDTKCQLRKRASSSPGR